MYILVFQFAEHLANIGFLPDGVTFRRLDRGGGNKTEAVVNLTGPEINANNQDPKIVSCVLAAALYPNVVQVLPGNRAELIFFSTHLNCSNCFKICIFSLQTDSDTESQIQSHGCWRRSEALQS